MFKKAFTLAEVLLVITIIGVVSALTIPNLANKSSDEQTVIKLKNVKNDLDLAMQQAILKYGPYSTWYSDEFTSDDKTEAKARIMEFLEHTDSSATFPFATYNTDANYTKYTLSDGTILALKFGAIGICGGNSCNYMQAIVATGGASGKTLGKQIFGFKLNPYDGIVEPYGQGSDIGTNNAFSVSNNINATNWALHMGNLDYLKCASSLNWQNKTSCD